MTQRFIHVCILLSGHRIGTAEVESALVSHPQCAEAAVVGVEHEVLRSLSFIIVQHISLVSSVIVQEILCIYNFKISCRSKGRVFMHLLPWSRVFRTVMIFVKALL